MAKLKEEIAAYEEMRGDLELDHYGEWVVIYNKKLVGAYGSNEKAAEEAAKRFGRGPFLIRQVGDYPLALPNFCSILHPCGQQLTVDSGTARISPHRIPC